MTVTQRIRRDPTYKVQVAVTLLVEEPATLALTRRYPEAFVGLGDMSRGSLMLRCAAEGRELAYVQPD